MDTPHTHTPSLGHAQEIRAIHTLLDDPSATVQEAVHDRLLALGEAAIPELRTLAGGDPPQLRAQIDSLINDIRVARAIARMQQVVEAPDVDVDLEDAMHAITLFGHPDASIERCRAILDEIASDVRILAGARTTAVDRFMKLRSFLFVDLGYTGNRQDYYNPDNSYLSKVLEHRRGIPITLAVLMLLIGRRLQIPLHGIGMPMHFLLLYDDGTRSFYIDAFNNGMIITEEQCRAMLSGSGMQFTSSMLAPVSPRAIIERMWRNLYLALQQSGDDDEAARVAQIITYLNPEFRLNSSAQDDNDEEEEEE